MGALRNPRHERFALLVAHGTPPVKAFATCGYKKSASGVSHLHKNPKVADRINELRAIVTQSVAQHIAKEFIVQRSAVLGGLWEIAVKGKSESARVRAFELCGKEIGMFVDRSEVKFWDGNPESLDDRQRSTLVRYLAQMAYPDDPAAAEAALRMPSGSEVIEATAEPEASTPEVPEQNEHEVLASHMVEPDKMVLSWADITDSEERKRLAAEWSAKGPALPEGLTREELIVWLNANWPPG